MVDIPRLRRERGDVLRGAPLTNLDRVQLEDVLPDRLRAGRIGSAFPGVTDLVAGRGDPLDSVTDLSMGLGRLRRRFRGLGATLVSYRPSIMTWWNVLALLIPIIITLAGAAVGLIAALGGVAVAAGAIVGIGLLGWGDSASESFQNLQEEARKLGSELFDVLRPVSATMQPIMEDAMGEMPSQVQRLNDELINIADFAPGLGDIGRGFIDWIESSLQLINRWREEILFVANEAGRGFGSFIQNFLVFGLEELDKNFEAYEKLAKMFVDVIRILFELAKVASFVVAQFEPFFNVASSVAQLFSNRLFIAILTFLVTVFTLTMAMLELASAMRAVMAIQWVANLTAWARMADQMILKTLQWFVAVETLRGAMIRLMALTGAGLVAAAGLTLAGQALQTTTGPRGGGGATNNITIQGDVGRREMHQLKDYYGYPDG